MANHCHNTPGLPHATPTSDRRPAVLTQDEWNELHDALELALDALGDGPQDVHMPYLINSMIHQRIALRLTHSKARNNGEAVLMNRRAFLAAAPAVALAGPVAAEAETPVAALFREWSALFDELNFGSTLDDAAHDAECERLTSIEARMMHTPSTSATDLIMKIASYTSWGDFEISDCGYAKADIIWAEARALVSA